MLKCPRCNKEDARINPVFGIMPGWNCIKEDRENRKATQSPEFTSLTQQSRIQRQRDDYERDMMLPYDHDGKPSLEYAKAYPKKSEEIFKEYSRVTGNEVKL